MARSLRFYFGAGAHLAGALTLVFGGRSPISNATHKRVTHERSSTSR
jgi:hypothetical protein